MTPKDILSLLLGLAVLLPLISFAVIAVFGPRMGKAGEYGGYVATAAIVGGFVLSIIALAVWVSDAGAVLRHRKPSPMAEASVLLLDPLSPVLRA